LLERTQFSRRTPLRILDLGCGPGNGSEQLKKTFRKAQVVGMDSSPAMLSHLQGRSSMLRPLRAVCADMRALPVAAASVDMVFSNLASYWSADPVAMFSEFRRVLRPDGMLLFSTFGPDFMGELAQAWAQADPVVKVPAFPDLLETGDALVAAGFREPVMDREMITLSYPELDALHSELEATGAALLVDGWERWKTAGDAIHKAYGALMRDGRYPLSFEIVYGVAFGPQDGQPIKTSEGDVVTFSVDSLRRSRPGKSR
jgi:malonyl-CoA O-methyltransferase